MAEPVPNDTAHGQTDAGDARERPPSPEPPEAGDAKSGERVRGRWRARSWVVSGLLLVGLIVLAAVWRHTPLAEWISIAGLERQVEAWRESPLAGLAVVGAYLVAGPLFLPVSLLTIGVIVTFGPLLGFVYSLAGSVITAMATYGLAHGLGRRPATRLLELYGARLRRPIATHGFLFLVAIRIVPMAPFNVVNLAAGVAGPPLWRFTAATALGMTPGKLAVAILTDRFTATVEEPGPGSLVALIAATVAIVAVALALHVWFRRAAEDGEL